MKKLEITLIVVIAVAIGIVFSYTANASTYGNFSDAFANSGKTYTVVGELNKELPIETPQANLVIFNMFDKNGKECKVYLNQTVPEHFDRSDNVVITGKADGDKNAFMATDVQLKCPSKYNDQM